MGGKRKRKGRGVRKEQQNGTYRWPLPCRIAGLHVWQVCGYVNVGIQRGTTTKNIKGLGSLGWLYRHGTDIQEKNEGALSLFFLIVPKSMLLVSESTKPRHLDTDIVRVSDIRHHNRKSDQVEKRRKAL